MKKKTKQQTKTKIKIGPKNSLSRILNSRSDIDKQCKIAVIGVGGGGSNAINALIKNNIKDITTIAYNTDSQALENSNAEIKTQIGPQVTKGHGAGSNPEVGKLAAQESKEEIQKHLEGVHVAFILAGMGGGTGTGAVSEIGKMAIEKGILTIGLVTTPFEFEGEVRSQIAQKGLKQFESNCDILIVIGNEKLCNISDEEITFLNAFELTDNVLCKALKSFIQTIKETSRINIDVSDFFTIMKGKKCRAIIGTGSAKGPDKAIIAAQNALNNPLLEDGNVNAEAIDGVIISIRCGNDSMLTDINQAVEQIKNSVSNQAQIIFGAHVDESMDESIQVSVFATINGNINKNQEKFDYKISDTDLIGQPHSNHINEEGENFKVKKNEPNFFQKIINLFIKTKEDNDEDKPTFL